MRDSKRYAIQPALVALTMTLLMVTTWGLMHRYRGLMRDGQLYAVQAMAKLNPALGLDVYLSHTSQDRFTVFSALYASFIDYWGLQNAELLLFVCCTAGFLSAAWVLAKALSDSDSAWLAVMLLITTVGTYGAYSIFHYSENYLTARSLAEALVVASLAAHFRGWRITALAIAFGAMFIHPLMALPGALLLVCLWLPVRAAILGAFFGVLTTLGVAVVAVLRRETADFIGVMDASWLEVVRERSQHLFLQCWKVGDWEVLSRPFLCLSLTAMVLDDPRTRRVCGGAVLVGGCGIAIAWIAGSIGPVPLLLQGQAWRWVWVTTFLSVVLMAPTILQAWRDERCGFVCSILVVSAWTFPAVHGVALVFLALILWSLRSRIDSRTAEYLRWSGFALIVIILAWIVANCWSLLTSARVGSSSEPALIDQLRSIFELQVSAVLLISALWHWIRKNPSPWKLVSTAVLLSATSILILPWSFEESTEVSRAQIDAFFDWRHVIPPIANVQIIPAPISASFVWFTLDRPSYYSLSQSAGVVFSRATALEIRRRSEVLLPVMEPDWRILSEFTQRSNGHKPETSTRPLTTKGLVSICSDVQLGFVIAKENLGFDPVRHSRAGPWKDWNLYDCRRVRSIAAAT